VTLPIEQGVGVGVLLSVLHGVWTTTRARTVEFECIPGTSVWWPHDKDTKGELVPGVRVIGLQAPLSFSQRLQFSPRHRALLQSRPAEADRDRGECAGRDRLHRRDGARRTGKPAARAEASMSPSRGSNPCARRRALHGWDCSRWMGRDHVFRSVQEAINALAGPRVP